MVKAILRGHAEHPPIQLPSPWQMTAVKQYWLPEGLERGQTATWMWPWEIKAPHKWWVALVAPCGQRGEKNLQIVPWVIGTWPPQVWVTYPGPEGHGTLLHGSFVISLWPIMSCLLLLQVDAEPQVEAQKVWYLCPGRPPLPATALSTDQKLACILPEGHDWSLLVPITALFVPRIQTNTLVDWVHTYASVTNQSACWVCTEIPLNTAAGLPWHISLASIASWTWL